MNSKLLGSISLAVFSALVLLFALPSGAAPRQGMGSMAPAAEFSKYVDAKGNITLPTDYAQTFGYLGTFAITEEGEVKQMHAVYARHSDIEAYIRDGSFPDGAVIVKEVFQAQAQDGTTGHAAFAKDILQWFVMVKDKKGRFAGNPNWGLGWGWALFKPKDSAKNISTNYVTDCKSCHLPAKQTDWNYVEGYPVLRTADRH